MFPRVRSELLFLQSRSIDPTRHLRSNPSLTRLDHMAGPKAQPSSSADQICFMFSSLVPIPAERVNPVLYAYLKNGSSETVKVQAYLTSSKLHAVRSSVHSITLENQKSASFAFNEENLAAFGGEPVLLGIRVISDSFQPIATDAIELQAELISSASAESSSDNDGQGGYAADHSTPVGETIPMSRAAGSPDGIQYK